MSSASTNANNHFFLSMDLFILLSYEFGNRFFNRPKVHAIDKICLVATDLKCLEKMQFDPHLHQSLLIADFHNNHKNLFSLICQSRSRSPSSSVSSSRHSNVPPIEFWFMVFAVGVYQLVCQ